MRSMKYQVDAELRARKEQFVHVILL